MRGPLHRYRALVAAGDATFDAAQEAAALRLQDLTDALETAPRRRLFSRPPAPPRGVYLWGGVGRGKSLLMDIFFNNTAVAAKRRAHFHEFMAEAHERIAAFRAADARTRRAHPGRNRAHPDDPVAPVAFDLMAGARLLCFDELQVTDIADAMLLGRLFEAMFARGLVMVATSNRRPDDLYKDGLNRQLFLPAIAMLKDRLDVIELKAARDYRLERLAGAPVWHTPLGLAADAAMDAQWRAIICGATPHDERIVVKGRTLTIKAARGAARASFEALCAAALGAGDYLAIAARFHTLFLDRIPRLGPESRNEAKRFVALVDALYEAKTKLVASAAVEPAQLYAAGDGAFEFERAASRLMEMRSSAYLGAEHVAAHPVPEDAAAVAGER